MSYLYIDLETYSSVDLTVHGVYQYVDSPDFEILMAAWSTGGPVKVAVGEKDIRAIPGLWDPTVTKVAHNASFDRTCLAALGKVRITDWVDTMALAAEAGLPQKLSKLAIALGLSDTKDSAGSALIKLFCSPRRGKRVKPWEEPVKWKDFVDYCRQDVTVLMVVHAALPDWATPMEKRIYTADQRINERGIRVDRALAEAALRAAKENEEAAMDELRYITNVENPGSVQQLQRYLAEAGAPVPNLQAATVDSMLASGIGGDVRRVLELRQDTALAATKKYAAVLDRLSPDDRLRGMYRFHGAHTGRWSGQGAQLHNLPRATVDDVDAAVRLLLQEGKADPQTLKGLVRSMFIGPLTVADYSAIEARVLAWIAGEAWVLDAFRTGRDIYEETAARMGGLSRREGKIAVLALGYNGGINSLKGYGAERSDNELQEQVYAWRQQNPRIVRLWARMEDVFLRGGSAGRIKIELDNANRIVTLPSGRRITYRSVRVTETSRGPRLAFWYPPTQSYISTYGGSLVENTTQAVARDILGEALVRLEDAGLPVVGHVHDEVLVEAEEPEIVSSIMSESPSWAPDLPMSAESFVTERYRKG